MEIKLIDHTASPEYEIYVAARRCYGAGDYEFLESSCRDVKVGDMRRFLRNLIHARHMSPFEFASATFAIDGISRACLAQLTRHRLASFCVQSQRYRAPACGAIVYPDTCMDGEAADVFRAATEAAYAAYQKLVALGVPREDARYVLPEGTQTALVVRANFREWLHIIDMRVSAQAQWEIRRVVEEIRRLLTAVAPAVFGEEN